MKEWGFIALLFELCRICNLKFMEWDASWGHFHLGKRERDNYVAFKGKEKSLKRVIDIHSFKSSNWTSRKCNTVKVLANILT